MVALKKAASRVNERDIGTKNGTATASARNPNRFLSQHSGQGEGRGPASADAKGANISEFAKAHGDGGKTFTSKMSRSSLVNNWRLSGLIRTGVACVRSPQAQKRMMRAGSRASSRHVSVGTKAEHTRFVVDARQDHDERFRDWIGSKSRISPMPHCGTLWGWAGPQAG